MIDSTLTWLTDTMIAVSIIIVVIMILRRPVARYFGANAAYLLWLTPLIRVFLPDFRVLPALPQTHTIEHGSFIPIDGSAAPLPEIVATPQFLEFGLIAAGVWMIGFFLFITHYIVIHHDFRNNVLQNSTDASMELQKIFDAALKRNHIERPVSIRVATDKTGPLVMGLFKPTVVVPTQFEADFSPAETMLVLDHECAHLKRGDLMALLIAMLLRAAFWPNPIIHYAYNLFRLDQEAACDERVIGTNTKSPATIAAYASAILKSVSSSQIAPATSLSMAHPVKERIRLMTSNKRQHTRFGNVIVAVVIASGLAVTANYTAQAEIKETALTEQRNKKSSVRKSIITVDEDSEEIFIEGWDGTPVRKIVFENRNGKRSIKAYNNKNKKVLDEKFEPNAEMPYKGARVLEDGTEKSFVSFAEDGDVKHPPHGDIPTPPTPVGHEAIQIHCIKDGDASGKAIQVYSWTTEDDEGDHKIYTREIICDNDLDKNASPEDHKASLQRAIDVLEEEGERSKARREAMIDELKKKLEEIE